MDRSYLALLEPATLPSASLIGFEIAPEIGRRVLGPPVKFFLREAARLFYIAKERLAFHLNLRVEQAATTRQEHQ